MEQCSTLFENLNGFSSNARNHLTLNGVDCVELATLSERPLYLLNENAIRQNIRSYRKALNEFYPGHSAIFYASKVFLNLGMCYLLNQEGVGLDVCSEGELFIAKEAHFPMNNIIFHGNNKSRSELQEAIQLGIFSIMVDNASEFEAILSICRETGHKANVMFRLNPLVSVHTHAYTATGMKGSKFGFAIDDPRIVTIIEGAFSNDLIDFKGIHFHVGSQIFDVTTYKHAIEKIIDFSCVLIKKGIPIDHLNIGGGLGVPYTDTDASLPIGHFIQEIAEKIVSECALKGIPLPGLMIEPGRSIMASAGCTLYKIGHIKNDDPDIVFAAINGGMSDNLRPALYQSKYTAVIANKMNWQGPTKNYKIVGKCCETGDVLISDVTLPLCEFDDILVVFVTGAYQHAMANNYNKHTKPGIILVGDGVYEWFTKEQPREDLIQYDVVPEHLKIA